MRVLVLKENKEFYYTIALGTIRDSWDSVYYILNENNEIEKINEFESDGDEYLPKVFVFDDLSELVKKDNTWAYDDVIEEIISGSIEEDIDVIVKDKYLRIKRDLRAPIFEIEDESDITNLINFTRYFYGGRVRAISEKEGNLFVSFENVLGFDSIDLECIGDVFCNFKDGDSLLDCSIFIDDAIYLVNDYGIYEKEDINEDHLYLKANKIKYSFKLR